MRASSNAVRVSARDISTAGMMMFTGTMEHCKFAREAKPSCIAREQDAQLGIVAPACCGAVLQLHGRWEVTIRIVSDSVVK